MTRHRGPTVTRAEFDALLARVAVLEALPTPPAPTPPRRRALDRQLVHGLMKAGFDRVFRAAVAYGAGSEEPTLADAMAANLIDTPQALGKALQRLQRAGLAERLGDDDRGALWRLRPPTDSHDNRDGDRPPAGESRP